MYLFEYKPKHADTLPYYDNFPLVREIFDKISNSSQIDVKDIIFNDNNKSLDITEFTQISIFCASISIFSVIKNIYGSNFYDKINFLAGHSLGEYSALTASGSLDIYNCSKILKIRGKCMQESYPERESGMLAVIGTIVGALMGAKKSKELKELEGKIDESYFSKTILY